MAKHKYIYLGETTVSLPTHGILAEGRDETTVYETEIPIKHPDFHEITDSGKNFNDAESKKPTRKERAKHS